MGARDNDHDETIPDILVLICTQSFTAEALVDDVLIDALLENLPSHSRVDVKLVDEAGLDWTEESYYQSPAKGGKRDDTDEEEHALLLSDHARMILLVASTYGDGDPPNHALQFADWLSSTSTTTTASVKDPIPYAVFGLGDKTYAHYNKFAKFINDQMKARGGQRILDVTLGDAQLDLQGQFQEWTHTLVQEILPKYFPKKEVPSEEGEGEENTSPQHQQQRPLFSSTGMDWRRSAIPVLETQQAKFIQREELLVLDDPNNAGPSTSLVSHITLELSDALQYGHVQPGDHLGIYPHNSAEVVQRALNWLQLQGDVPTTIMVQQFDTTTNTKHWMPHKITAYEFLSRHVDLSGKATPSTLRALLPFVGTLSLRALARELTFVATGTTNTTNTTSTATANKNVFEEWMLSTMIQNNNDKGDDNDTAKRRWLNKLELAILFECRPSLQGLARAIGPLQPRLYSIATVDQYKDRTRIGICVSMTVHGLCTNYVAQLSPAPPSEPPPPYNSGVAVFVKKSKFHYPDTTDTTTPTTTDTKRPVILVGAGSGVGPYIGFLQQALLTIADQGHDPLLQSITSIAAKPLSHVRLLIGAQTPSHVLYQDKLQHLERLGGIQIQYAFSRVPGQPKQHVQDLLLSDNSTDKTQTAATSKEPRMWLWEDVFVNQGKVYACGRLEICDGVRTALWDLTTTVGQMPPTEATRYLESMEQQGRLLMDCWSVESSTPSSSSDDESAPEPVVVHTISRLERHHNQHQQDKQQEADQSQPSNAADSSQADLSTIPEWPSYLRTVASGEFERRLEEAADMFTACVACGRYCEVDRLSPKSEDWGECRLGQQAIVSAVDAHFGEEPCLKGVNGSGTIFFGACNLKCIYCQNWKLSVMDQGEVVSDDRLADFMLQLQERGCHNINLVSPTHNILPILRGIYVAAQRGLRLPIVFNSGGYDSVASLRLLDGIVDIYMPDAKYASRAVARKLSKIDNYPEINQAAIKEMHRQVGDLQIDPRTGLAYRGLLVRHLVLPNDYGGTQDVADFLTNEVSKNTYTHVMKYYRPEHEAQTDQKYGLNRKPSSNELQEAHNRARFAGLHRILY